MTVIRTKPYYRLIAEIVAVVIANGIYAAATALFVVPNGLITCGTAGIAIFVNKVSGFPIAVFTNIFYAVMFVVGLFFLGRKFAVTTIFSSISYPLFYTILEPHLLKVHLTDNLMLSTVYAGLLIGPALRRVDRRHRYPAADRQQVSARPALARDLGIRRLGPDPAGVLLG